MSMAEDLAPNKRYDRVAAALAQLSEQDRLAWLGALESGDYSHPYLASKLEEYTTESVKPAAVGHYKRKKGL